MSDEILDTIKKLLDIPKDLDYFDTDVKVHINSAMVSLNQLGVGPREGFILEDGKETWSDYVGGENVESVKTYIYLKVKEVFDPPSNAFAVQAIERQLKEIEWRLSVQTGKGGE